MPALDLPDPYRGVDEMIEREDYVGARAALASATGSPDFKELLDVKVGLRDGSLAPQLAMNRLLVLMRKDAKMPGTHEVYREASERSYEGRSSSLAHSHPPPPIKPK